MRLNSSANHSVRKETSVKREIGKNADVVKQAVLYYAESEPRMAKRAPVENTAIKYRESPCGKSQREETVIKRNIVEMAVSKRFPPNPPKRRIAKLEDT